MRNRIHGRGTMAGASIEEKKRNGSSLNLTAHINSRERVSFRHYKSLAASKRVFARCSVGVTQFLSANHRERNHEQASNTLAK